MTGEGKRIEPEEAMERELDPDCIWAGMDESWYSPHLTGPCIYAAVWLPLDQPIRGMGDSKLVPAREKRRLFREIALRGIYAVAFATPQDFARYGMTGARDLGAGQAREGLLLRLRAAGIDAGRVRFVSDTCLKGFSDVAAVRAGERSYLVAAASIVAWAYRQGIMAGWEQLWPEYGGLSSISRRHMDRLREYGPSPAHRWLPEPAYARDLWEKILGHALAVRGHEQP